jgi:two-component system KDP operon response regulator KdpE
MIFLSPTIHQKWGCQRRNSYDRINKGRITVGIGFNRFESRPFDPLAKECGVGDKILVIEDDEEMLELIQHILVASDYEVVTALNGQSGLEKFADALVDLVVLDIMMPKIDGWEVCRRIRAVSSVPIIMLTGLGWHQYVVKGLEAGADDYIAKPFHPAELLARVEAMLRRIRMPTPSIRELPLTFSTGLCVDPEECRVMIHGEVVNLTPMEFELILFMARHAGQILPASTIFTNLWPHATDSNQYKVKWYISRLRKKIERDPRHPAIILTEYGIGYRLAT